ncbi:MAG: hypothetical protein AAGK10_20095 [Cyanobacteria bacterium J06555_3]
MKEVLSDLNDNPEALRELDRLEVFDNADFKERAKAAYRAELEPKADYGELSAAEQSIFLDLIARKVQQQGAVEDIAIAERVKTAYKQSQITETELPKIESDEELAIFLNLLDSIVNNSGYLANKQWQERAKAVYKSDREKERDRQLDLIEEAIKDFNLGCDRFRRTIAQPESETELQQAIAQIIRGSYYLLTLTEQYLYPRRNWLQRKLYKKLPVLNFSKFRVEERIKTIRYTINYLERAIAKRRRSLIAQEMQNDIHKRRVEQYIKALPTEVCHLTEWLKARVKK